ncbi:hypothetical protein AB0J90_29835 [Micromonospora sp. NPDC049523]|uniref:hypothetical protein n=1 Tax=Micromonospora sp. NPDC049523 TaxID=3155921 RepID=UPI00341AD48E
MGALVAGGVPETDHEALRPFLCWETIRIKGLARSYDGLCWGGERGKADDLQRRFPRTALLHEDPGAEVTLPEPLPVDPMPAEFGPRWASMPLGVHDDVVTAVAGVARRMFGGQEDVPDAVAWLLDEPVPVEADETTREFVDELMELVNNVDQLDSHPDHDTTALIPFAASLAREEALPAGVRVSVLGTLLEYAVPHEDVLVDALGHPPGVRYRSRREVVTAEVLRWNGFEVWPEVERHRLVRVDSDRL